MSSQSPLVVDLHEVALSTVAVVSGGQPVGYFYRHAPDHEADSGWVFMVGNESAEYVGDVDNILTVHVHHLLERYPELEATLRTPAPCAFTRTVDGIVSRVANYAPPEG